MSETRDCGACGEQVAVVAQFCPMCGQRQSSLDSADAQTTTSRAAEFVAEFDDRESQQLSRELFQAHADLLRKMRNDTRTQSKRAEQIQERFDDLESEVLSPETTRAVQDLLLEVEDVGERWEEVQHRYNNESEALDEEYIDRFNELEMDVDLPESLQNKINEELEAFGGELDSLGAAIKVASGRGESLLARSEGRWFQTAGPVLPPWLDGASLVVAALLACVAARVLGVAWQKTMLIIAPLVLAWAGVTLARHWRR